jgi:hypothetical protein
MSVSPDTIVAWVFTTAFVTLLLVIVAIGRYYRHRHHRTMDILSHLQDDLAFISMDVIHVPNDAPTQRSSVNTTSPGLRTSTYLDITALRLTDDMLV